MESLWGDHQVPAHGSGRASAHCPGRTHLHHQHTLQPAGPTPVVLAAAPSEYSTAGAFPEC